MVRSDLVIAGSNFIFSHINENYGSFFLKNKRKLLVIFRGINSEYFSQKKVSNEKLQKQIDEWHIKNKGKEIKTKYCRFLIMRSVCPLVYFHEQSLLQAFLFFLRVERP